MNAFLPGIVGEVFASVPAAFLGRFGSLHVQLDGQAATKRGRCGLLLPVKLSRSVAAWQWAWYEILRATSARFAPVWGVVSGCHVKGQTSVEKETAGRQLNEVCGA